MDDAPASVDPVLDTQNGVPVVPNGVHAPELIADTVLAVLDDPTTPVSNAVASDLKIDIDLPEQESDVRHEPLPHVAIPPEPGMSFA
jgi:hypothetical protein